MMNVAQRWRLKAERAAWRLDQPRAWCVSMWLVPIFFGLVAMSMRQDSNWDLRNYHLYNPFAWLNGKIGLDLAPAQMQSYFNPTIDLLYYGLTKAMPVRVTGFLMGAIHGLNFLLLALIARESLAPGEAGRVRVPLLLAFAGMLSAGFIAQLGNTMGDNLTTLFVLGSLLQVLRHWRTFARGEGATRLLVAGVTMGLGIGLKLTNGIYAPALCLALLMVPTTLAQRIRAAFIFGIGVLIGILTTGGHWYWKMWTVFGNPLYPQFNTIFQSPMAGPVAVGDTRFLPHGFIEKALWPFIFAMNPHRISEIKLSMVVWPVLYVAVIALIARTCYAALKRPGGIAALDPVARSRDNALLVFVALAYLIWLNLFSIHRYLMPLELVAPLIIWIIAPRIFPRATAGKIAGLIVLVVIASSLHTPNWGRTGWGKHAFDAETQVLADTSQSIVFTTQADPPLGWIATFYPADLAFVSLVTGFESKGFLQKLHALMAERKGPKYVMMSDSGASIGTGLDAGRTQQGRDADAAASQAASRVLADHGMQFGPGACVIHPAHIGDHLVHYRLCPVTQTRVPG
jgi:hypothetical protein